MKRKEVSMPDKEKESGSSAKELKALRVALRKAIENIQTFKSVSAKNSNVVLSQDAYAKQLGEVNTEAMKKFESTNFKGQTDKKLDAVAEILFRNFEIFNANHEMIKAYVDEYYDRFLLLEKNLNTVLYRLDTYLGKESK